MKISVLTFAFLILSLSCIYAEITSSVYAGLRYDSNICSLSEYDLNRFANGEKDFLIETSDDAIVRIGGNAKWSKKFSSFKIESGLFASGSWFTRNNEMSYLWTQTNIAATYRGTRLKLTGAYIPQYHTRAFLDDDTDSTVWTSYWSASGEFELRQRIALGIYAGCKYEYQRSQYNDYFPEYDSDRNGITFFAAKYDPIQIEAGWTFQKSIARGYDQQGETKDNSEETDISYEQDVFFGKIGKDFTIFKRNLKISFDAEIAHRVYVSEKPYLLDPLHAGRDEWTAQIAPDIRIYMTGKIWSDLNYEYSFRRASSELNPDIPMLRDFDKHQVTMTIGIDF